MADTKSKATDPYRVVENVVRAEITAINSRGEFPGGFHLVKQGAFTPGDETSYGSVRVVCLRDDPAFEDRPFSLHQAVLTPRGDSFAVYLIDGTYDLTVEQAAERLAL